MKNPAPGRVFTGNAELAMAILVLVFMATTRVRLSTVITEVVAHCAPGGSAETCTDGRTGRAAEAVADHRTTGSAKAAANGGFGTVSFVRADCTARGATDTCTDRRAGTSAKLATDYVAQRTTQATAHRSSTVPGRHCALSHQQAKYQSR
jgi:hypothetical protein